MSVFQQMVGGRIIHRRYCCYNRLLVYFTLLEHVCCELLQQLVRTKLNSRVGGHAYNVDSESMIESLNTVSGICLSNAVPVKKTQKDF